MHMSHDRRIIHTNIQQAGSGTWVSSSPNLDLHSILSLLKRSSGLKRAGCAFRVQDPSSSTTFKVYTRLPCSSRQQRRYIVILIYIRDVDNPAYHHTTHITQLPRGYKIGAPTVRHPALQYVQDPSMYTEQSQEQLEQACIFCPAEPDAQPCDLFTMMNQALVSKHQGTANNNLTLGIDILLKLEDPTTAAELQDYITYREWTYVDRLGENLKREYGAHEFDSKIRMLSQYYKYHKDIPHVVEAGIEKIMGKYYDRIREFDYKCIKKILKQEQGLSITSVDDSMSDNSETITEKSRYSTMLGELDENKSPSLSDSNVLHEICQQIGNALPKLHLNERDFDGMYFESNKNFESYVRRQQKIRESNKRPQQANTIEEIFKKKARPLLIQNDQDNYFNFDKRFRFQEAAADKTKRRQNKIRTKRFQKQKQRREKQRNQDKEKEKKKFIYNTNIKIQIQNALIYPNAENQAKFGSANYNNKQYNLGNYEFNKSRKSLAGKINSIKMDTYKTPLSKIYRPQETQVSSKYVRRSSSFKKEREKIKTKESRDYKQFKDDFVEEVYRDQMAKRSMSSHNLKRAPIESIGTNLKERLVSHGSKSVTRIKLDSQRIELLKSRGTSLRRGASEENIRRRSITLTQPKKSVPKVPLSKYASSQFKDSRPNGVTIKELLSKKLNIHER